MSEGKKLTALQLETQGDQWVVTGEVVGPPGGIRPNRHDEDPRASAAQRLRALADQVEAGEIDSVTFEWTSRG